jgi:hypothetical protein
LQVAQFSWEKPIRGVGTVFSILNPDLAVEKDNAGRDWLLPREFKIVPSTIIPKSRE